MKKVLLLLLTISGAYRPYAQVCGTPHPTNPTIYPSTANARVASSAYCIDVFFHIVRHTNGTNAFTPPNTDDIVKKLNEFYNPHRITINNAGVGFINYSSYVTIDDPTEARNLGQTNNRSDAINYYIVERLWNTPDAFITGIANKIPSDNLVIRQDYVLRSTSPHELGHCLDLYHTHETSNGVEAINGSNCSSAGDLICDTPADPILRPDNNVNFNCVYTGGGGYNPLTDNIMSYAPLYCRDNFTNGQGVRMRAALEYNAVLSDITSSSCVRISSLRHLSCSTSKITLSNRGNATTTWTSSSNVRIVSSSNSSVTIKARPSNSFGNGWVKATLNNGVTLKEEFTINCAPNPVLYASNITLHTMTRFFNGTWNLVTAKYNGRLYNDRDYTWEWQTPASYVRVSSEHYSYINLRPNTPASTLYIGVRVCNRDGRCSAWKSQWFPVIRRSGGSSNGGNQGGGSIIEY